jgi:hypothetical protein
MRTCHNAWNTNAWGTNAWGTEIDLGFQRSGTDQFHYDGTVTIIAGKEDGGHDAYVTTSSQKIGTCMYWSDFYLRERTPRQIVLPGTHNSGMGKVTPRFDIYPTPDSAVICQAGSVWDQLNYGIRFFDTRPAVWRARKYYTGHLTPPWGATGQSIRDTINHVNDFTYNNAEPVIASISHNMNVNKNYAGFGRTEWDVLLGELDRLTHRFDTSPNQDISGSN